MKTSKIKQQAIKAKALGYTHIASVVKSVYDTVYYNVNEVDDVIANGWTPASHVYFESGAHARYGITRKNLPEKTILKTSLTEL